jgi:hypothetical protein
MEARETGRSASPKVCAFPKDWPTPSSCSSGRSRSPSRHDLVPELARLHHLRGNILFPLGKIEGCREAHEQGLAYARRLGSPEAEARALGGLADAAYAQGVHAQRRRAFQPLRRLEPRARLPGIAAAPREPGLLPSLAAIDAALVG